MRPGPRVAVVAVAVAIVVAVGSADLQGLAPAGRYALGTMVFAGVLWVSGALPLAVTALAVPVVFTVVGVYADFGAAPSGFADPVLFLLFAGFALAAALRFHDVDRRVALLILARMGSSPRRLVLGVMVTTAGLSMVVSNTATVAMMVPIALGMVDEVASVRSTRPTNLEVAALLGIAYAASIGGVGTLIGTPPNAIVAGQLAALLGYRITFATWLVVGLPTVVVLLPVAWYLLVGVVYPVSTEPTPAIRERARADLAALPPLSRAGRRTLLLFGATATLWVAGGLSGVLEGHLPAALHTTLFGGTGPTVFGTTGHQGVLYYVVVGLAVVPLLGTVGGVDWDALFDVDWQTLVLLGGGISLASGLADTGATGWLADRLFAAVGTPPVIVLVALIVTAVILIGELASNTAMAAVVAPLLIGLGPAYAGRLGTDPTTAGAFLAVVGGVAASYGFALPVAAPPNAIVYGEGSLDRTHLLRAGVPLDAIAVVLATVVLTGAMLWLWPIVLP